MRIIIVPPVTGTPRGDFLKIPIALPHPYLGNEQRNNNILMDYNSTPKLSNKIISLGPASRSIMVSPA
jgi:hypothetical protein